MAIENHKNSSSFDDDKESFDFIGFVDRDGSIISAHKNSLRKKRFCERLFSRDAFLVWVVALLTFLFLLADSFVLSLNLSFSWIKVVFSILFLFMFLIINIDISGIWVNAKRLSLWWRFLALFPPFYLWKKAKLFKTGRIGAVVTFFVILFAVFLFLLNHFY